MKQKMAFLIGYNGIGYHGLQYIKSEELPTVERPILETFVKLNYITLLNSTDPHKVGLMRCCRTDKGVHAALNIIVLKVISTPSLVDMNKELKKFNIHIYKFVRVPKSFVPKNRVSERIYEYFIPLKYITSIDDVILNCKRYVGVKNFSNFTTSKNTKGEIRNIISVEGEVLEEYIKLTLTGQSFMLHQIRKMVGLLLLIDKYRFNSEKIFDTVFNTESHINIPKAPPQYLLLSRPVFDHYNKKHEGTHQPIEVQRDQIETLKEDLIYSEIFRKENLEHFDIWYKTIEEHNYEFDYLRNLK